MAENIKIWPKLSQNRNATVLHTKNCRKDIQHQAPVFEISDDHMDWLVHYGILYTDKMCDKRLSVSDEQQQLVPYNSDL